MLFHLYSSSKNEKKNHNNWEKFNFVVIAIRVHNNTSSSNCFLFKTYKKYTLVISLKKIFFFRNVLFFVSVIFFMIFIISDYKFTDSVSLCELGHHDKAPPPPLSSMWPYGWGSGCTCLSVRLLNRRPRLGWRERRSVTAGTMDYQQKLAEKLVILNERGSGVLVRMNYIKKVRASRKSHSLTPQKRKQGNRNCVFNRCPCQKWIIIGILKLTMFSL